MKFKILSIFLCCMFAAGFALVMPGEASAKSEFFSQSCASCHFNDTATCDGCHIHGPKGLTATTDLDQYQPGQAVTVMFGGGTRGGWIRAILYNQNGVEVARSTGPTGGGDDGTQDPALEFPVLLSASAPSTPGFYTWSVSWYGSPFDAGNPTVSPHVEENVLTNQFEVVSQGGGPLTQINSLTPPNESLLGSLPTFSWQGNGGANNAFAVDLSLDFTFSSYWSTHDNLGQRITGNSWTPPASLWDKIPSGSFVYWRIRGADRNQTPLNIITGAELWWFYKM